jgi:hypothetical protein
MLPCRVGNEPAAEAGEKVACPEMVKPVSESFIDKANK